MTRSIGWFALALVVACGGNESTPTTDTDTGTGAGPGTGTETGGEAMGGSVLVRYDTADLGDDCMFGRYVSRLMAPSDDEVVAIGYETPCGHNDNIWLGRIAAADGALLASFSHNGVQNFRDIGYDAAPTGDGRWAVVGTVDFQNSVPESGATWFGVFAGDGTESPSVDLAGDARDLAVVPGGYVLVARADPDATVVIGLDAAGAERWRTTREFSIPSGITADAAGNVYVAGVLSDQAPPGKHVALLFKVDPSGAIAWERTHDPEPSTDQAPSYFVDVALAPDGAIVVGGYERRPEAVDTGLLLVHDPGGEQTALHRLPEGCRSVRAFAVDPGNGDFVTVCFDPDGMNVVMKFSPAGEERWRAALDTATPPSTIAVAPNGAIWTTVARFTMEGELRDEIVGLVP
ncbi:hypothetical protein SAMN02745121_02356 [Nannocystis exedens]|uniref:Uncharacterized protein n=1 Tax=Nannocystis exedens TaxID=54 RepID=A0A1I1WHQ5_9BACT|nr:hypothetical protein [Nannocystis exedens]PCC67719.1 hypothetical protein NAEX_00727 [Nannocystis exedens]SFD94519.1 hypothetical protein SAMN02745121_02356 [Nannocystis exedens]